MSELRGLLAFVAIVLTITFAWQKIEDRTPDAVATTAADAGDSTSTTTTPATTTTARFDAVIATCERSERYVAESELVPLDASPAPQARLAQEYWDELIVIGPADIRGEVDAVADYYRDYRAIGEPFDFDVSEIILEGDKERYEQLITRPAPGFEDARERIRLLCGVEVAEQPTMSSRSFDQLENRLLFGRRRTTTTQGG